MRVCLVCYRGNPYAGGQGIYLFHLGRELARAGHEVEVIVGPPYPEPMDAWARVHRMPNLNLWGRYGRAALPPRRPLRLLAPGHLLEYAATRLRFFPEPLAFSLRAARCLGRILRRRRFDIIHDVQSLGYGMLAMRAFGVPMVTTVHHPLTIDRRASFARDRSLWEAYHTAVFYPVTMQGRVIRRMERVITASRRGMEAICADFRVSPERMAIVPNGLDTDLFRNPGDCPRAQNTLLFVGNTDDVKKGALHLLQAMRFLPGHVRLRIVDEGAPAKSLAPDAVARLGLEGRVTFTGRLSTAALVREYATCTLLVQPSLYEGFGLPAAEAMACETPVVATDVGAVNEVVLPGTGRLVPAAQPAALAAAIRELLADPAQRAAMGRAGRAHMVARHAWPICAANTVAVYEQVLRGEPGSGSAVA